MANFLLLFLCLVAGIGLRASRRLPSGTPAALNAFVIHLSLPALTVVQLHGLQFHRGLLYPVAMGWLLFALAVVFFVLLGRHYRWSRRTVGALVLTAGFSNTSFVGFPLLEAIYGPEALRTGILVDQLGTFLPLATVGIVAAGWFSARDVKLNALARRVLLFPPFLALVCALVFRNAPIPAVVLQMLDRLGATLIPLALVSVGYQLDLNRVALVRERRPLGWGLFFKLALGPALLLLLYVGVWHARGRVIEITLLEAAMAPMITGSVLAVEFGLDADVANLLVAVGIPLSLVTVPLWSWLLAAVAG